MDNRTLPTSAPPVAAHAQTNTHATSVSTDSALAIDVRGLTKSFGRVHAVNGIDLQVASGEIVAFLGPNGAGKTTTIDMLLGLSKPDSGSVTVHGHSPRGAIARGQVSAVLQSGGLLKDLTVRDLESQGASTLSVLHRSTVAQAPYWEPVDDACRGRP
jgi:ABC-type Fe3+/spermidine/putrescine transport system ATPase subunit